MEILANEKHLLEVGGERDREREEREVITIEGTDAIQEYSKVFSPDFRGSLLTPCSSFPGISSLPSDSPCPPLCLLTLLPELPSYHTGQGGSTGKS